jgi:RNA recognition motif-containing protein
MPISPDAYLWLRGLPFRIKKEEVLEFLKPGFKKKISEQPSLEQEFSEHLDIKIGNKKKKNGPKMGDAWVSGWEKIQKSMISGESGEAILSEKAIVKAAKKLDKKTIEDRYIEVSFEGVSEGVSGEGEDVRTAVVMEITTEDCAEAGKKRKWEEDGIEGQSKKRRCSADTTINTSTVGSSNSTAETSSGNSTCSYQKLSEVLAFFDKSSAYGDEPKSKLALRLFGLPFSSNADDILASINEKNNEKIANLDGSDSLIDDPNRSSNEEIPANTSDIWIGDRKYDWQDTTTVGPVLGECWIYGFETAKSLCYWWNKIHKMMMGDEKKKRFIETSIVGTETGEILVSHPREKVAKGDGKGAKGKGKGKGNGEWIEPKWAREIFARFLPYECSEEEIKSFFSTVGEVDGLKLFKKSGIGFVYYKTSEIARKAVAEYDDAPFNSRTLKVRGFVLYLTAT